MEKLSIIIEVLEALLLLFTQAFVRNTQVYFIIEGIYLLCRAQQYLIQVEGIGFCIPEFSVLQRFSPARVVLQWH